MNRQCGMLKLRIVGNGGQNVYSVSYGPSFWSTEFPNFSSRYQIFSFIIISVYACRNKQTNPKTPMKMQVTQNS